MIVRNYIVTYKTFNLFPYITLFINKSIITCFPYITEITSNKKTLGFPPESNEIK